MGNPKNMALATRQFFVINSQKRKTWRQMKTNANANENNLNNPNAASRQKIEERAYHIWLEGGCGHGDHERHWLQAEKELMETAKHEGKRPSAARERNKTAKPGKSQ